MAAGRSLADFAIASAMRGYPSPSAAVTNVSRRAAVVPSRQHLFRSRPPARAIVFAPRAQGPDRVRSPAVGRRLPDGVSGCLSSFQYCADPRLITFGAFLLGLHEARSGFRFGKSNGGIQRCNLLPIDIDCVLVVLQRF